MRGTFAAVASLLFFACTTSPGSPGSVERGGAGAPPAVDAGSALDAGAAPDGGGVTTALADDPGLLPSTADGWTAFAARAASNPGVSSASEGSGYALEIAGNGNASVYGGWKTQVRSLQGNAWYRFTARAVPQGISSLRESITIVLRWSGSFGEEVSPDYVWDFQPQPDGSMVFDRLIQAPPGTSAVEVELVLQWAASGSVSFDHLSLSHASAPTARPVRVAAIYDRPSGTSGGQASVQELAAYAQQVAATYHPDVIVLGEMTNVIGASGTYEDNAEPIPGPSTKLLSSVASQAHVNIAFGLLERDGDRLYNSAVLLDRNGAITGKYRKVQLPLAEASQGISPGDSVPVFTTDFGHVALLICQDTSFPEPAREAALQGAELLLVPIWGGRSALVHARAVENGIFLAASGYDYASEIVDPLGNVVARATIGGGPTVAIADIDLSQRFRLDYLGDPRDFANKERRAGPYRYAIP